MFWSGGARLFTVWLKFDVKQFLLRLEGKFPLTQFDTKLNICSCKPFLWYVQIPDVEESRNVCFVEYGKRSIRLLLGASQIDRWLPNSGICSTLNRSQIRKESRRFPTPVKNITAKRSNAKKESGPQKWLSGAQLFRASEVIQGPRKWSSGPHMGCRLWRLRFPSVVNRLHLTDRNGERREKEGKRTGCGKGRKQRGKRKRWTGEKSSSD